MLLAFEAAFLFLVGSWLAGIGREVDADLFALGTSPVFCSVHAAVMAVTYHALRRDEVGSRRWLEEVFD